MCLLCVCHWVPQEISFSKGRLLQDNKRSLKHPSNDWQLVCLFRFYTEFIFIRAKFKKKETTIIYLIENKMYKYLETDLDSWNIFSYSLIVLVSLFFSEENHFSLFSKETGRSQYFFNENAALICSFHLRCIEPVRWQAPS